MKRLHKLGLICLLTGFGWMTARPCLAQHAPIQPVRNTVGKWIHNVNQTFRDYHWDKPFQYQPSDPWTRSKLFREHTHHHGLFYNCDNEECKRYSPYICWKVHHEQDFPRLKFPTYYLHRDLEDIRRRVQAGSCRDGQSCGPTYGHSYGQSYGQSCGQSCGQCAQGLGGLPVDQGTWSEIPGDDVDLYESATNDSLMEQGPPVGGDREVRRPVAGLIARTVVGAQRVGQRVTSPLRGAPMVEATVAPGMEAQMAGRSTVETPLTGETCQCERCAQARAAVEETVRR